MSEQISKADGPEPPVDDSEQPQSSQTDAKEQENSEQPPWYTAPAQEVSLHDLLIWKPISPLLVGSVRRLSDRPLQEKRRKEAGTLSHPPAEDR